MPGGFYDYIANLSNGSQQALQALIKKKFGLVGKHEMRVMDVLLLKVEHPKAQGLRLATPLTPGQPRPRNLITQGVIHYKNQPFSKFAKYLEQEFQIPLVDQTGLTGNYDLDVPESFGGTPAEKLEEARQWLLDDFGLKLVPARQRHEVLVIEKVK
jgi:uncharacterized protein (TIGR03435 family)